MTTENKAVEKYTTKDGHVIRQPEAEPTVGQKVFASRLGIKLDGMNRAQSSEAIDKAVGEQLLVSRSKAIARLAAIDEKLDAWNLAHNA